MALINFKEHLEEKGSKICSICHDKFYGFGNNPKPFYNLTSKDRCCDVCNELVVLPRRLTERKTNG